MDNPVSWEEPGCVPVSADDSVLKVVMPFIAL